MQRENVTTKRDSQAKKRIQYKRGTYTANGAESRSVVELKR